MAEQEKVLWDDAFPSNYFGHQHMPEDGSDVVTEIKEVRMEMIQGSYGADKKLVATLSTHPEKWIVAKVNGKTINKVYGTKHPYQWVGKKIQLYVDPYVKSPQGVGPAIRVREFAPQG